MVSIVFCVIVYGEVCLLLRVVIWEFMCLWGVFMFDLEFYVDICVVLYLL